jgi:ABC-2 type transport system ATP-binding protein
MKLTRIIIALVALITTGAAADAAPARAASPPYTTQNLTFTVKVGPPPQQTCTIVGELFKPIAASAEHPVPAVLTTNGFGGSYSDQIPLAQTLAARGYGVLTYSGLGFGGSGCQIELDSPTRDGEAASQLVTFLGGGSAADNGTRVDWVIHDRTAHDGRHYAYDPRVGMIGGSYGGEIQFAAAGLDPRIDTIVPVITWNNLGYSLAPNNALDGPGVTTQVPGVAKFEWIDLFFAVGLVDGVGGALNDPSRELTGCPNFDPRTCGAILELNLLGAPTPATTAFAEQASVESYMQRIRIPTMLMQGEDDTLFNLHEAVATYAALRAQHTPVKMVWQSWGHSHSTAAPGEYTSSLLNPDGSETVEGRLVLEWFDHYLKGDPAAPALDFSYFQPWVSYPGNDAAAAYSSAPAYPLPAHDSLYLSGTGGLVSSATQVSDGQASFVTPPAGAPTSTTEISAVSQTVPLFDAPGTYAEYETAPLRQTTDVVGIPSLTVKLSDPAATELDSADPAGGLTLFFKLEDIAPDGTVTLPDRLISPARFADLTGPVTVSLPGIVHRFPAGDRIALVLAGSDSAYRGDPLATPVTVQTSTAAPGTLTLPVARPGTHGPLVFAAAPARQQGARHHARHRSNHRRRDQPHRRSVRRGRGRRAR